MNNLKFYNDLNQIDLNKWKMFHSNHEKATIFQNLLLFKFWKTQKNNKPFAYFVESERGECLTFCIGTIISTGNSFLNIFSRRAIIFGGPLLIESENCEEILSFLIDNMENDLKNKSIYMEIRNFSKEDCIDKIIKEKDWTYIPYQNYIINLKSESDVFKNFNSERRRQIRKGLREGVQCDYEKTRKNINAVYNVLLKIYTIKIKKPFPTLKYFTELMLTDFAGIVCVKFENEVIGGGFFLMDEHTIYDWYRGGLDSENKKKYPSAISDWYIMKYGLEHNLRRFDFMGAGIKGKEYGVRVYKSRFGGELVEFGRYRKTQNKFLYKLGQIGLKFSNRIDKSKQ